MTSSSGVTFVLFCFALLCFVFRLYAFVGAGSPFNRPSICRRPDSHTCFFPFVDLEMSLFSNIVFVPFPLSLCLESTSYVLSFRIVFFYLVTTGWIVDISLCENSINKK